MSTLPRGARVALFGEFAKPMDASRFVERVALLGGNASTLDDPALTHVVRGARTRDLAARIGPSPRERELTRRTNLHWLDEEDFHALAPAALRDEPTVDDRDVLATLRDELTRTPRHEVPARRRIAGSLIDHGTSAALEIIADALRSAPDDVHLARAFGVLAARGVTRFAHRAPIAVECPQRRTRARDAFEAIARDAGAVERFCDDEGRRWLRTRFPRVPPIPPTRAAAIRASFLALILRAAKRRHARVWIAGCALPAQLSVDAWIALLAPLGEH